MESKKNPWMAWNMLHFWFVLFAKIESMATDFYSYKALDARVSMCLGLTISSNARFRHSVCLFHFTSAISFQSNLSLMLLSASLFSSSTATPASISTSSISSSSCRFSYEVLLSAGAACQQASPFASRRTCTISQVCGAIVLKVVANLSNLNSPILAVQALDMLKCNPCWACVTVFSSAAQVCLA